MLINPAAWHVLRVSHQCEDTDPASVIFCGMRQLGFEFQFCIWLHCCIPGRVRAPHNLGMLQTRSCLLPAFSSPISHSSFSQSWWTHSIVASWLWSTTLRKSPDAVWQEGQVPVPASQSWGSPAPHPSWAERGWREGKALYTESYPLLKELHVLLI